MALFQKSVINNYLKLQNAETVLKAYRIYTKYFHNATIQENIKGSKEEQYQAKFLDELFVTILGFTMNPKPDYNLTTEYKNEKNNRKVDGALLSDGKAIGVIELKGTNTKDLESIRKQAFDYKANQKDCVYVITSNFEKLRFYINDATEFLEFNLFNVSEEEFALLFLCLHKDAIVTHLPLRIKEESITQEEQITKKFYADYSVFKRELFRDLVKQNAKRLKSLDVGSTSAVEESITDVSSVESKHLEKNVKLALFKKSQKLIDRFLFIFFAEDRGLLPANSTVQILNKWKADVDFGDERPLYNLFKHYFHFLDSGRKGTTSRAEIYAYNGGLFKPDALLDSLVIDDALLYKHTLQLANYDFESQVDVNILGHIFENSLNEIESVNAEIEGAAFDKQKSKRKKDGVFYTPKYITKYIVANTVGKLCEEKKVELGFEEEEYFKGRANRPKKKLQELVDLLDTYRAWLLQLTICDPACGSGAFLNQALDFLIKEHRYLDELKATLLGSGIVFSDIETTILENNIYGVDLNEESVEIAKLSLWLRTAQPRRKLNDLSSNIKCGNSLIDDKKVAGDKAFSWQEQFPKIFGEKEKKAFHITTAIHDSRTSERMIRYKVREKRAMGTNPYPNVVYFTPEDDLLVTQTISNLVKKEQLQVLAYNICADHIHLLLVCEEGEIPSIMQKIKGRTSYEVNKLHGVYKGPMPLGKGESTDVESSSGSSGHKELKPLDTKGYANKPLWGQKYYAKPVTTEAHLYAAINYIEHNRVKHELPAHSREIHDLIDAMTTSVDVAFSEQSKGGFDVVIGNPPYVRPRTFDDRQKQYIIENYKSAENQFDLYHVFIEKSEKLRNENGIVSLILPNAFLANENSQLLRKYILENCHIQKIIDCKQQVFNDASVEVLIYIFDNSTEISTYYELKNDVFEFKHIFNAKEFINNKNLNFTPTLDSNAIGIFQRIKNNSYELGEVFDVMSGIKEYQTGKGKPPQVPRDKLERRFNSMHKEDELYVKEVRGKHLNRFCLKWENEYIKYGPWLAEPRNPIYFDGNRFLIRQIPAKDSLVSCFTNEKYIVDQTAYVVKPKNDQVFNKAILGVLNSKLIFWFYRNENNEFDNLFPKIKAKEIRALPVTKSDISGLNELVGLIEIYTLELVEISSKFHRTLQRKFEGLEKLPKKLESWYELTYAEFIKELGKKKIKLALAEEAEWEDYFVTEQQKAVALKGQIDATDREIDGMVYALYGLTEEEIGIVEQGSQQGT